MSGGRLVEHRTGWPWLLVVALVVGAAWVAVGIGVRPLRQTCDAALPADVCLETIDAAIRRGLPRVHPLLVSAYAEPGPAAGADQLGHRATVTFEVLGIPRRVAVRLFFDAGAHWGGIPDMESPELALWSAGHGLTVGGAAAGAGLLLRNRLRRRDGPAEA